MEASFPVDGIEITAILVLSDVVRSRDFYRDPDGHLFEISQLKER